MDPAKPFFEPEKMSKNKHCLSIKDAIFVQILHTSMGGKGHRHKLGTQDYYANCGEEQEAETEISHMSHQKAANFFNAAIFQVGLARGYVENEPDKVYIFGIHHDNTEFVAKPIYLPTTSKPPYFLRSMERPQTFKPIHTIEYNFDVNAL